MEVRALDKSTINILVRWKRDSQLLDYGNKEKLLKFVELVKREKLSLNYVGRYAILTTLTNNDNVICLDTYFKEPIQTVNEINKLFSKHTTGDTNTNFIPIMERLGLLNRVEYNGGQAFQINSHYRYIHSKLFYREQDYFILNLYNQRNTLSAVGVAYLTLGYWNSYYNVLTANHAIENEDQIEFLNYSELAELTGLSISTITKYLQRTHYKGLRLYLKVPIKRANGKIGRGLILNPILERKRRTVELAYYFRIK